MGEVSLSRYADTYNGQPLCMGRSCVRFRTLEDPSLAAIADAVAAVPMAKYIEFFEQSRKGKTQ